MPLGLSCLPARPSSAAKACQVADNLERGDGPKPALGHTETQGFEPHCPPSDLQIDSPRMSAGRLQPGQQHEDNWETGQIPEKGSWQGNHQRSGTASRMSEDQRIRVQNLLKERKIQLGLKSSEGTKLDPYTKRKYKFHSICARLLFLNAHRHRDNSLSNPGILLTNFLHFRIALQVVVLTVGPSTSFAH